MCGNQISMVSKRWKDAVERKVLSSKKNQLNPHRKLFWIILRSRLYFYLQLKDDTVQETNTCRFSLETLMTDLFH